MENLGRGKDEKRGGNFLSHFPGGNKKGGGTDVLFDFEWGEEGGGILPAMKMG